MFDEYKEAVLNFYRAKSAEGTLSPKLIKPTPAGIKKEWIISFETRRKRADIETLRTFFGEKDSDEEYLKALKKIDIDKFRPLCKFLSGEIKSPKEETIELLAWLINFSPRPYKPGFSMADAQPKGVGAAQDDNLPQPLSNEEVAGIYGSGNVRPATLNISTPQRLLLTQFAAHRYKVLIAVLVLLTGGIGITLDNSHKNSSFLSFMESDSQCMYWNDDHFEEIDCDTKPPYGQAVALEKSKLDYFKKITQPDTLTLSDINKVWYLKTNHQLELYTADGNHPAYPDRRLRPLTKYMFDKYVAGKSASKDER